MAIHACHLRDADGRRPKADAISCGTCSRSWCARCDPTPADLCPWCNGAGGSSAPLRPVFAGPRHAPGSVIGYESKPNRSGRRPIGADGQAARGR